MHKSLQLGVAIYGVLKAGGVFVPLDPFIPAERLKFIVDDCDIEHVVSADELAANLQALAKTHACCIYGVDADTGADQFIDVCVFAGGGDLLESVPYDRVVGQDQVGFHCFGLGDDGASGVDGDEDVFDAFVGVADQVSDVVPILGQLERGDLLNRVCDVFDFHFVMSFIPD